jgi:hypothetical protein
MFIHKQTVADTLVTELSLRKILVRVLVLDLEKPVLDSNIESSTSNALL